MNPNLTLIAVISLLLIPATSVAQESSDWQSWPLADRFTISVDAMFPNLDTRVSVDASDGTPGTTIVFEQNLGMSDTETLPAFGVTWRFAKKHQVGLKSLTLNRSGSSITSSEIRIGDEVFTVDLPISSFFDMQVYSLEYNYSFILDERKELALGLGVSVQNLEFGLIGNGNNGIIRSESDLTAPVPTIGLHGGYAFTNKWIGRTGFGFLSFDLAVDAEKALSGDVLTAYASIQHNTFELVYFGLSYQYFDVSVDWSDNGLRSSVGYNYHGPAINVTAAF